MKSGSAIRRQIETWREHAQAGLNAVDLGPSFDQLSRMAQEELIARANKLKTTVLVLDDVLRFIDSK